MLHLENIKKIYKTGKVEVAALAGIDLKVEKGEKLAITGPSGSGKSTLMHIIGCLDQPDAGDYHLEGEKVSDLSMDELSIIRNKKIGFVFQNFFLLPYISAYENIELPMIFAGVNKKKRKETVDKLLELTRMTQWGVHKPNEMSGGQQQRIAIARALANDPEIILADEPTGNLDSASGRIIIELFDKLWEEGKTIVMITHDGSIASQCARQVTLVDGKVDRDVKRH